MFLYCQVVPRCGTGVGKRPSVIRSQIDTRSPVRHDEPSVCDDDQERWTRVGRVSTGIETPCCVVHLHT